MISHQLQQSDKVHYPLLVNSVLCIHGSVLGPRLFILYMEDLDNEVQQHEVIHTYVDDSQPYIHRYDVCCGSSGTLSGRRQPLDVCQLSEVDH